MVKKEQVTVNKPKKKHTLEETQNIQDLLKLILLNDQSFQPS